MKLFGQVFMFVLLAVTMLFASSVQADYGCPLTSSCSKHCKENKFKDGVCEGTLKLTCHCIG